MDTLNTEDIGKLVLVTVENDMRKNTQNNYTLSDYVSDFEGTDMELNIALIKMAAKIL